MNDDMFDLTGLALISEMSKEDIIDELLNEWRRKLSKEEMLQLKAQLIELRLTKLKERMIKEAGLEKKSGIFGMDIYGEDNGED